DFPKNKPRTNLASNKPETDKKSKIRKTENDTLTFYTISANPSYDRWRTLAIIGFPASQAQYR
ncbi:MAG: hypothetical protein LWY06_14030, partial [Firmicutes bacterium]|nr:hypothetical protein [Bacillota bacterium]